MHALPAEGAAILELVRALRRSLAAQRTARRLHEARRAGTGLYVRDWVHAEPSESALDHVLDFCRSTIGASRRPFGIDHFDLALAWRPLHDDRVHTRRYHRLRPIDLYGEGFASQLQRMFAEHWRPQPQGVHVAVALFSWGDAAHVALPPHS